LSELEGKILRLELDGSPAADNPYVGQAGKRPEIFASGFRNPFRFGFDPATGRLWAGDVGQDAVEEIDVVVARGDYGWPHCEGPVDMVFGPDGALYYVAYLAGAVRRIASTTTPPACATIADCETQLAAALPNPAFATTQAIRRVAERLRALERKASATLTHAA